MSFSVSSGGGEYKHKLTIAELANHSHPQVVTAGSGGSAVRNDYSADGAGKIYSQGVSTTATGGNNSHNNIQPYFVVYFWRRTA